MLSPENEHRLTEALWQKKNADQLVAMHKENLAKAGQYLAEAIIKQEGHAKALDALLLELNIIPGAASPPPMADPPADDFIGHTAKGC